MSRTIQEYFGNKAIGVTTNVPGPQHTRYLAGQEMVGILGWVPGAGDQSIGVCIFSYDGQIRVGFKTDVNVVPDIGNLVAAYISEMAELLALASPSSPRGGRGGSTPGRQCTLRPCPHV